MKANDPSREAPVKTDHTTRCLLTDLFGRDEIDQRRTSSIEKVIAFRESIAGHDPRFDKIDELVEEIRQAEFEGKGATP